MKRLGLLLLLIGCSREAPKQGWPFVDSRGKTVLIASNVRRVVSLIPGITEMVHAAGAGERLVAVSEVCDYPESVRRLPRVGGVNLDPEQVLAFTPDLVLSSRSLHKDKNERLEKLGITVFTLDPETLEGVIEAVALLEKIFGSTGRSEALRKRLAEVTPVAAGPRVFFEYGTRIYAAGRKSYVGEIIARAGGRNVIEEAWPTVEWEQVLALKPQVIFVAHNEPEKVKARPGWTELGAKLHVVDPNLFLRAGPRLIDALELTVKLLK